MLLNEQNLGHVFTGFKGNFLEGIDAAEPQWPQVAMKVTSGTRQERYGWLGQNRGIREWLGDRVINALEGHGFLIENRPWESTIEVDRDDISDDQFGTYAPLFRQMGEDASLHPDQLVYQALLDGFAALGYDGQPFFDTDHPVLDANGVAQSVANTDGGSGDAWFLIDGKKSTKPLVYQERKMFEFVRKDRPEDDNSFLRRKFLYGIDGRNNVGYGFWQLAWGSKQPLTADSYAAARATMMGYTRDGGTKLGVMPNTLVVGPALEQTARQLIMGGDRVEEPGEDFFVSRSNEWQNSAELVVSPYL